MNDKNITKKERASKLIIDNRENAVELVNANNAVSHKNDSKGKHLDALIDSNLENSLNLIIVTNKELEVQNKEKDEQITALIEAKKEAAESGNLKLAFLNNMSHEIRTPMNGILGFADLLREPELENEKRQKYLKILEKSGKRLLKTIDNIVDMSKIHSGLVKVNIKKTNINKKIEKIYNFLKPEADRKGINFVYKISLPTNEAFFLTDCEKLYAVLIYLIKNAIKYTDKGSIEFGYGGIKSTSSLTELLFFVKDTGIGIPKKRQKAIFNSFTQADIKDINALQGNGLGLSITKAYVEMLGGKIWAESDEGKGAKFYFSLPYRIDLKENILHKIPSC